MIQVVCDKCGKDCGLNAFVFTVEVINNPCPVHIFDEGTLKITCDGTKIRMITCQDCYRGFGFPNIHKTIREKKLTWRDTKDAVEVVRCKDCRHFDRLFKGEGVINKIGTCYLRKEEGVETAQSCDDFCSYGERKERT